MSRILVVGSSEHIEPAEGARVHAFGETCRLLGAALAKQGHEMIVCSSSPKTADHSAIAGANEVASSSKPTVLYFISRKERDGLGKDSLYPASAFPNINLRLLLTGSDWFSTYSQAIDMCDAVISIGGSPRGTGGALYIALSKGKPVLAIPAAGGVSKAIWSEFETAYGTLPGETLLALERGEPIQVAQAATQAVAKLIEKNPFQRPRRGGWFGLMPIAMLAFFAGWAYLAVLVNSKPSWLPYVVAVVTAMAGMLLRYANDDARKQVAYAGAARLFKDLTRVLGALLGICILINFGLIQAQIKETNGIILLANWLALAGFGAGFLVEETTDILTRALNSAIGALVKRDA